MFMDFQSRFKLFAFNQLLLLFLIIHRTFLRFRCFAVFAFQLNFFVSLRRLWPLPRVPVLSPHSLSRHCWSSHALTGDDSCSSRSSLFYWECWLWNIDCSLELDRNPFSNSYNKRRTGLMQHVHTWLKRNHVMLEICLRRHFLQGHSFNGLEHGLRPPISWSHRTNHLHVGSVHWCSRSWYVISIQV